jgi:glucokinase
MALILADVGGTNVRFACARDGRIDAGLTRRYQNDGYASFDAVLEAFVSHARIRTVEGLTVAIAGPVTGPTARLTNRDWHFNAAAISESYDGADVNLMNDLSALGYALDLLSGPDLLPVLQVETPSGEYLQRLVVGIGTGFNVSPVLVDRARVTCLQAEAGLGSPPQRVMTLLDAYLKGNTSWVRCVEDVFSGAGLSRLHAVATGHTPITGREVIEKAGAGDPSAGASLDLFATCLAECVQDLRLLYMPMGGIFLAGSVVRAVMESSAKRHFIERVRLQPTVKSTLPPVGISVITQDEAALLGCLAYALRDC